MSNGFNLAGMSENPRPTACRAGSKGVPPEELSGRLPRPNGFEDRGRY